MIRLDELERDALIVVCAISAGIHGALTPDHLSEGTGAGLGFLVATVLLAALAIVLTLRPQGTAAPAIADLLSDGLVAQFPARFR